RASFQRSLGSRFAPAGHCNASRDRSCGHCRVRQRAHHLRHAGRDLMAKNTPTGPGVTAVEPTSKLTTAQTSQEFAGSKVAAEMNNLQVSKEYIVARVAWTLFRLSWQFRQSDCSLPSQNWFQSPPW